MATRDEAREAARGLGVAQRAHVKHGIAGATVAVMEALERRGLVVDAPERPGCVKLSPLGEAVRDLLLARDAAGRCSCDDVDCYACGPRKRGEL